MQLKGASYEVTIENGFDEACMLPEASRLEAKPASIVAESADSTAPAAAPAGMEQFTEMLELIVMEQRDSQSRSTAPSTSTSRRTTGFPRSARGSGRTKRASTCCARAADRRALPDCARHRARRAPDRA